jgi:cation diffusion facilitator family transporter
LAAASIIATAVPRLFHPKPLEQVGFGLGVSVAASLINLFVSQVLLRAGKQYHSITLEADARHLITDVWTSAGVLVGVGAVTVTGWVILDPIVACLVAANIVWSGMSIVRKSVSGLMDTALPIEDRNTLQKTLEPYMERGVRYHALRTRESGARKYVSLHVLVPGSWTVQRGHRLLESMEADIRHALQNVTVFTHLESLDDPTSWDDTGLDRSEVPPPELPAKHGKRSSDEDAQPPKDEGS